MTVLTSPLNSTNRFVMLVMCMLSEFVQSMSSLVPRPFLRGRGKTAWAPLLAHARRSHKNSCTLGYSAYTSVISRNISVHDYELTGFGVKLCFEKTLDMPFLAYFGCSKLLKARAVGTHTRFTVSVGIDPSLTKIRRIY